MPDSNHPESEPTKIKDVWDLQDVPKPTINYMDSTNNSHADQFVTAMPVERPAALQQTPRQSPPLTRRPSTVAPCEKKGKKDSCSKPCRSN